MFSMWYSNELEWKQLKGAFKHKQFMLDIIHIFVSLRSWFTLGLYWENEAERDEAKILLSNHRKCCIPYEITIAYMKTT